MLQCNEARHPCRGAAPLTTDPVAEDRMAAKNLPDAAYLRECLDYDPETGVLTWKPRPREHFRDDHDWHIWLSRFPGKPAGGISYYGYIQVALTGRIYRSHRIIWAMQTGSWPVAHMDHINRDRSDNRWVNLRQATAHQNMRNRTRDGS